MSEDDPRSIGDIGGSPVVTLRVPPGSGEPAFTSARDPPGPRDDDPAGPRPAAAAGGGGPARGRRRSQRLPEFFAAGPAGFPGNASYLIGGAILLPYANRIRGTLSADGRTVTTRILGREVRLPANAGGRRPGAERYSMHGLILDSRVDEIERRDHGGSGCRAWHPPGRRLRPRVALEDRDQV